MMIFKKAVPRRKFLRGLGAALALPVLDSMVPALGRADAAKGPLRLGIVYAPNGMWPMDKWTPKTDGAAFDLSPTLEPLAPFKDKLLVLSRLAHKEALALPGEGPQDHSRASGTYLSGVRVKPTAGKDFHAGISMDQIAAKELCKETQLASLEIGLFSSELVGVCDSGWTCIYQSTLCWRTPTTPLPMERSPRALFERLFGDSDSTDRAERLARINEQRSILDWVAQDLASFVREIGPGDRAKLNEYLDAVRDVERRIQIAEGQSNREVPDLNRPAGIPASFEEYAKLMFDLQILAYQTDLTRVSTFMIDHEQASRAYPEIGIPDVHHTLSHHQNNAAAIEKLFRINLYHVKLFAYFLDRLRSTRDGDGNLLDHSVLLYGGGLSNGNTHDHFDLPTLLVGGAGGRLKGGRHIRYPDQTPMANLHLTLLDKLGVPMEKLGDSTGELDLLSI